MTKSILRPESELAQKLLDAAEDIEYVAVELEDYALHGSSVTNAYWNGAAVASLRSAANLVRSQIALTPRQ